MRDVMQSSDIWLPLASQLDMSVSAVGAAGHVLQQLLDAIAVHCMCKCNQKLTCSHLNPTHGTNEQQE